MNKNTIEIAAGQLYQTYCDAVGGVAFNGDPLPSWEEFAADENKTKQADAWRAVATEATEFNISKFYEVANEAHSRAKIKISELVKEYESVVNTLIPGSKEWVDEQLREMIAMGGVVGSVSMVPPHKLEIFTKE